MTPLEQCLDEQRQALAKLERRDLSDMERFLCGLWLEDWVKEELILRREVGREKRRDYTNNGVPAEDATKAA